MAPIATTDIHPVDDTPQASEPFPSTLPLGEYVFRRIRQQGVGSVFGVPGDFNLGFLEYLYNVPLLRWVGTCNELNAAYAADGYARHSNKFGVCLTTYGVGELSAINGIAGAYAEFVPVLHIVGTSPSATHAGNHQLHHLVPGPLVFQAPNHNVYSDMVDGVCCGKVVVTRDNLVEAPRLVDELFAKMARTSRPGYLFIPLDLGMALVDGERLLAPLAAFAAPRTDPSPQRSREVAQAIVDRLHTAANPCLLADVLTHRFRLSGELRRLVDVSKLNTFTTFMGKGVVDESVEPFVGDYNGALSAPGIQQLVEREHDLVLHVGAFLNEINTGKYSMDIKPEQHIQLHHEYVSIGSTVHRGVSFEHVLPLVVDMYDPEARALPVTRSSGGVLPPQPLPADISQLFLNSTIQQFLKPNDTVVCETGSFMFGLADLVLPRGALLVYQGFYLSIGYALPACLGVGVSRQDQGEDLGRLVLIEGDGLAQMTIQEFGSYLRHGIAPTIFLLNNSGYTVERIIEGPTRLYNDIAPDWEWTKLFGVMGDVKGKTQAYRCDTRELLAQVVADPAVAAGTRLQLIEVVLHPMDAPWRFSNLTKRKMGGMASIATAPNAM